MYLALLYFIINQGICLKKYGQILTTPESEGKLYIWLESFGDTGPFIIKTLRDGCVTLLPITLQEELEGLFCDCAELLRVTAEPVAAAALYKVLLAAEEHVTVDVAATLTVVGGLITLSTHEDVVEE